MSDSFQTQTEVLQYFPEQKYFQNCIVIGELPADVNLDQVFSFFHDIPFWKKSGRKLIPDLLNPHMKAVVVSFDNENLASLCAHRVNQAIVCTTYTLYDGIFLFHHCKRLDEGCDPRSRNVVISGFDTNVPKSMYKNLFKVFGSVKYFEFCVHGEIPKGRIEYTRVTSAFAAAFCLQGVMSSETLVTMEIPMFPIVAIGPMERMGPRDNCFPESDMMIPISLSPLGMANHADIETKLMSLMPSPSFEKPPIVNGVAKMPMLSVHPSASNERYFGAEPTLFSFGSWDSYSPYGFPHTWLSQQEEFKGQCFLMCSMNSQCSEGALMDWRSIPVEELKHRQMEECTMEAVSFEISRKRLRERGAMRHLSRELFDNFDKVQEESLKVFLQAAKRKFIL